MARSDQDGHPLGTRICCDVEPTLLRLVRRPNNVMWLETVFKIRTMCLENSVIHPTILRRFSCTGQFNTNVAACIHLLKMGDFDYTVQNYTFKCKPCQANLRLRELLRNGFCYLPNKFVKESAMLYVTVDM